MQYFRTLAIALIAISFTSQAVAQDDADELKIAALEALLAAPPEKAYPLAAKVLRGNSSDEVKESALFVLSQIDLPEAQNALLETAQQNDGEIRLEAIRMIGIGGHNDSLAALRPIFEAGDNDVKEAVLEAYLIADDADSVYEIAVNANDEDIFEEAVEMLGAMGANDHLRRLRESAGASESLIEAYAIAGDSASLREIAMDASDPELQTEAIEALGIVGGSDVNATLLDIYKNAESDDVREAALDGMLISGYDEGVLELYRSSQNPSEKRDLLQYLVMMDSDAIYDAIDEVLSEDQ